MPDFIYINTYSHSFKIVLLTLDITILFEKFVPSLYRDRTDLSNCQIVSYFIIVGIALLRTYHASNAVIFLKTLK
jgi:dolichol kinase